jgi:hypothetical protein
LSCSGLRQRRPLAATELSPLGAEHTIRVVPHQERCTVRRRSLVTVATLVLLYAGQACREDTESPTAPLLG